MAATRGFFACSECDIESAEEFLDTLFSIKFRQMTKLANSRWFWVVFVILTIAVYFSGLTIPFVGPDEPRYAQVAREMFERRDWITPTLGGYNWLEKPALLYWLQIASYNLFGVTEFAAGLGSAVFGLATVGCLSLLGRNVIEENGSGSEFAKLLAA